MTWRIHHRSETESTNKDALGGMPGDVFTASWQSAGRGRLDHKWLSPAGVNLIMSAVVGVGENPPQEVATLPLVAGLSAAEAVADIFKHCGISALDAAVKLKWPNDVLVAKRKICGILCERSGDNVIIGVGMNVNQSEFAAEIADRATSVFKETGKEFSVGEVRDTVLDRLSENLVRWQAGGFAGLWKDIGRFDCLKGRLVAVLRVDGDEVPVKGVSGGIRPDGMLDVGGEAIPAGEAHLL